MNTTPGRGNPKCLKPATHVLVIELPDIPEFDFEGRAHKIPVCDDHYALVRVTELKGLSSAN